MLIGALAGFARYNFSPARIFLGDSGSLFIGFMLAVLSMHGSIKSATAVLVAIPLFALAVPLLDVSVSILRRWLRGVPIFSPDARHIHHRLLALGLTPGRASFVLCLVAGGFAALGLLLAFAPPPALIGMALTGGLVSAGIFMYGIRQLDYNEFVEAGAALASGIVRVRRVIRDQIHARELTSVIEEAESLRHVNAILAASITGFGFLGRRSRARVVAVAAPPARQHRGTLEARLHARVRESHRRRAVRAPHLVQLRRRLAPVRRGAAREHPGAEHREVALELEGDCARGRGSRRASPRTAAARIWRS